VAQIASRYRCRYASAFPRTRRSGLCGHL